MGLPSAKTAASGSSFVLQAAALGLLAYYFLPELILAAGIEYGKERTEKYVEKKLKKRLEDKTNKRNRSEEDRFMSAMLRRINAAGIDPQKKHHPLYFLVDPLTRNWRSRRADNEFGVQPGHTLSHKDYGFAFALEDAMHNQRFRGDLIESSGGGAWSAAIVIDGVYIDLWTANRYEGAGYLPKGTCKKSRMSVGWIDFSGILAD